MTPPPLVHIHYFRPPDRKEVFTQHLLLDDPAVKVTFAENVRFDPPIRIHGRTVLEAGSDAIWFTFPGLWHDIGRFHLADGTFTGVYANILTPPILGEGGFWHTTDLFLDLWLEPEGTLEVLDEDELTEALERGWVTPETARRAREEVVQIRNRFGEGSWPPSVVEEWTLAQARKRLGRKGP